MTLTFSATGLRKRGTRIVCSRSWPVPLPWNVWINFDTPVELRRWSVSLVNKPWLLFNVLFEGEGDFFLFPVGSIRISNGSTTGFMLNPVTCEPGEFCWLFDGDCRGDERLFVVVNGGDERFLNASFPPLLGLCCCDDDGEERLFAVVVVESR